MKIIELKQLKKDYEDDPNAYCIFEVKGKENAKIILLNYTNKEFGKLLGVTNHKFTSNIFNQIFPLQDAEFAKRLHDTAYVKSSIEYHKEINNLCFNIKIYYLCDGFCGCVIKTQPIQDSNNVSLYEKHTIEKENQNKKDIVESIQHLFGRFVLIDFDNNTYEFLNNISPYKNEIPPYGDLHLLINHLGNMIRGEEGKKKFTLMTDIDFIRSKITPENPALLFEIKLDRFGEKYENINLINISFGEDGKTSKLLVADQDVTSYVKRRHDVQDALKIAFDAANTANKSKTRFLSNMSHDIRTPLNAILGMTTIAQKNINDKEKLIDCLSKIEVAGKNLLNLVNDILDISKIENQTFSLSLNYTNLYELLDEVSNIVNVDCNKKRQMFTKNINIKNNFVYCDAVKLKRILLNVLSNSVKYTGVGKTVTLKVVEKSIDKNKSCYLFKISDSGSGMDKGLLKNIFEPFVRAENSYIEGYGLGMPIAKNLTNIMNGEMSIESKLGKGTTVNISICFDKAEKKPNKPTPEKHVSISKDYNIMIVEDNAINLEIAVDLVSSFGFKVDVATNGKEAINKLIKQDCKYDMVLMDIHMPIMDGYQATTEIRNSNIKYLKDIPIIAMTADAFIEDKLKALQLGMNDHISKPIYAEKLKLIFEKFLK